MGYMTLSVSVVVVGWSSVGGLVFVRWFRGFLSFSVQGGWMWLDVQSTHRRLYIYVDCYIRICYSRIYNKSCVYIVYSIYDMSSNNNPSAPVNSHNRGASYRITYIASPSLLQALPKPSIAEPIVHPCQLYPSQTNRRQTTGNHFTDTDRITTQTETIYIYI